MLENPARSPAQRLARRLLAEAKSCPALVHRSRDPSTVTKGRSGRSFPAMALLSEPALDIRQYLEDLVTIAVGSAQQARHMLIEARKVNRTARRRVAVVASFGALGLIVGIAGLAAGRSANVRLSEVREEVGALQKLGQDIASLQQQRKAEEAAFARQQAAREALLQQIADLQQQAASLRDQVARGSHDVNTVVKPSPSIEALRPAQEASAADNSRVREAGQHNIISPRQQPASSQDQVARRNVVDALKQERKAEQATPTRQKPHGQQMVALPPRPPSAPSLIPASASVRPAPVLMPEASAYQQLLIARQWLATGHLDQARHVLAMVQTRLVLQPVEPDQPNKHAVNVLATEVGNAIRWLDMGANGQAMQALNQAVFNAGVD